MTPVRCRQGGWLRMLVLLLLLGVALGLLAMGVRDRVGLDRPELSLGGEACAIVPAPAGPEDLAIDGRTGMAVIAALDRRTEMAQGDLWTLDVADPDAEPRRLERDGPEDFRPHGLSLVRVGDALYAWVVNHPQDGHSLESFLIADGRAVHRATVRAEVVRSPNDVVAVDADRFYVTNDHGSPPGPARLMEDLLGLNLADVVYYDGQLARVVADGLSYANGVDLSRDGTQLVVSQTLAGTLTFMDREPETGSLAARLLVDLDAGVDNVSVAPDGSFWVASHPRLLDFVAHARDGAKRSPTWVHRIQRVGSSAEVALVLADDGGRLSGGSVAAAWGDTLLVGGVFDDRLLRCALAEAHAMGGAPGETVPGT
ncbi:MAG TPA: SMP-30/gluconolactonase/LRE family protein [Pseudomonadales bacterium]|nr:SMP-30/gluconolactonase/LRE family protein [Pseudomonadales bacterium]